MYSQECIVKIEGVPKGEPIDLYILKRGATLTAAAVTSDDYKSARIEVSSGIRDVPDFTRLCKEHEFPLVKDRETKQYNLEFSLDMLDTLCSVDGNPCSPAEFPEQLVDHLVG